MKEAESGFARELRPPLASLDEVLRRLVRDVVREEVRAIVREELAAAAPAERALAPTPLYLSPKDAAAIVGVAEKTIRAWVHSGKLKAKSLGRLIRITRADLDLFMEGGGGRRRSTRSAQEIAAEILGRGRG